MRGEVIPRNQVRSIRAYRAEMDDRDQVDGTGAETKGGLVKRVWPRPVSGKRSCEGPVPVLMADNNFYKSRMLGVRSDEIYRQGFSAFFCPCFFDTINIPKYSVLTLALYHVYHPTS